VYPTDLVAYPPIVYQREKSYFDRTLLRVANNWVVDTRQLLRTYLHVLTQCISINVGSNKNKQ
jgi:hypothetical protein